MPASSELGPVELAPTAFGGRDLALTAYACDRSDRAGYAEHEEHSSKRLHGGQCK